ncbi:MAG TPA: DUF456 domain-containing protein [Candidatus Paceibacterota bacterium]|jgi:Protein of unknown function (DUF456).
MVFTIIYICAVVLVAAGIPMAFVPMLPALSYMFAIAFLFALATRFATLSGEGVLALLAIALVSILIDHVSGALGAKYGGAHTKSLLWGIAGAIVGTLFLPTLGSFIGLFVGVLAGEMYYKKSGGKAIKAAASAVAGSAVGVAVNVALSVVFFAAFALAAWR